MNKLSARPPFWSTASFDDAGDTSPAELLMLGKHLYLCRRPNGRWFAVQCMAQTMNGFVKARLITSLVAIAAMVGLVSLLF